MRNAEATRELILKTAMDEFSAFGIAGARVERIAKTAGCNKNLIYVYFENKETLFTTVLQRNLDRAFEDIPFTPGDLPEYTAKVFDFAMANPDVMRLLMWSNLEKSTARPPKREDAHMQKVQEIRNAQGSGSIGSAFPPNFILTLIMSLATAWSESNPFGPTLDPDSLKNLKALRESIIRAITVLLSA